MTPPRLAISAPCDGRESSPPLPRDLARLRDVHRCRPAAAGPRHLLIYPMLRQSLPLSPAAIAGCLSLSLLFAGIAQADDTPVRPNFVIFVADDLGWEDSGPYGNPHVRTPTMDRLAAEGLVFDQAILTTSSCSPSRASILTGRYPHNTGAPELHQPLPADQVLLATPLRQVGYYTAAVGKWHLGAATKPQFDAVIPGGGPSGAEDWLPAVRDRPRDRPFFLWLAAIDPHRNYIPGTIASPHDPAQVVVPPYLPDTPEVRSDLAHYYDEITRFDANVGAVLEELAQQAVLDQTFVLVISDNGRPFPRSKTRLLDSGIRTPFIVRWPAADFRPGSRTDALVSAIDIVPTVLELAHAAPLPSAQGESFAPVLQDPAAPGRRLAFAEHNWHDYTAYERAARDARFTYVRNYRPDLPATPPADAVNSPTYTAMRRLELDGRLNTAQRDSFVAPRPAEELYDNHADPHSLHNLVADPTYAAELQQLRTALNEWIRRTDDRLPTSLTPDRFNRETGQKLSPPPPTSPSGESRSTRSDPLAQPSIPAP